MIYNHKNYKKCQFEKMGKRLVPKNREKNKNVIYNKGQVLKEWRDGWFKGQYESEQ